MESIRYSFHLWDKSTVSFDMPMIHSSVDTSKFFPTSILTHNNDSGFAQYFSGVRHCSDPNEVEKDLREILSYINTYLITLDSIDSFVEVVDNSVQKHIQTYGRLFLNDLCSYIDLVAYIMSIDNFSESTIQKFYIKCIYHIVKKYDDLVKDGGAFGTIVAFSTTLKYRNVLEMIDE